MGTPVTDPVQLVSIVVSAILLVTVVELVRRRQLTEEYSFIWIVCAIALLGLSLWRNLLDVAAAALGVHYPPALLLLVLTFFVVLISLSFSIVVSRHRKRIERLVEEVALLDADLRALRDSIRTVAPGEVVAGAANERGEATDERSLRRH
jgi:hypothetical protein